MSSSSSSSFERLTIVGSDSKSMRGANGNEIGIKAVNRCEWKSGDPVLFQIRSMKHVHYDAGHWFHMSENIMIQVSDG